MRKGLLIAFLLIFTLHPVFSQNCTEILSMALKKWEGIRDYSCVMKTYNRLGSLEDNRTYEYRFLKPNYVYMKVLEGKNKGATVFYDPEKNKVKGCKRVLFKFCRSFDPSAKKVTSIRGVKVYETSFGYILSTAKSYLENQKSCEVYKKKNLTVLELSTEKPLFQDIVEEKIYLNPDLVPVLWERFSKEGLVYRLSCENIKINNGFSKEDLKP